MFIKNIQFGDGLITIDCFDTQGRKMTIVLDGKTVTVKPDNDVRLVQEDAILGARTFRLEDK